MGYDLTREENLGKIKTADFSNGDPEPKPEKKSIDLRFDVAPEEAIDYFRRKRVVTMREFNKLEREAKAAAFAVSGVYREDVLDAFKFEIQNALETGQTPAYVTKQLKEILAGKGHKELGNFHLESIVRSNMHMAYGVGQRRSMEAVKDLLPFWQYEAIADDRVRPTHWALHGVIFPADHPFWDTHYPPWDFMCRCTVNAIVDYPAGYDHKSPNPDTLLMFDDAGIPTKAEYQTQIIDLKARNFTGVPNIAGLEAALTDAANAAKDSRLLNHQRLPQVVVDEARKLRQAKKETLVGWDKDGKLVGKYTGSVDMVAYPAAVRKQLKDGFDVHNHPKGKGIYFESFSGEDIEDAISLGLKVMYAVSRNYLYQIRRPRNGWKFHPDEFHKTFRRNYDKIMADLRLAVLEKRMTVGEMEDLVNHLAWKKTAEKLKFRYRRYKVDSL